MVHLDPLRIGIICNETNREDLVYYKKEFISINKLFGNRLELVFFGYNGADGDDDNWLEGVNFEYVKPVSIIHYFKQLKALNVDLIFIPLIRNDYNITSENYNKYLEAGCFGIPILTIRIYPYHRIITDKFNGFLYDEKEGLLPYLEHLNTQRALIQQVGQNAQDDVKRQFDYTRENIQVLSDLFQ